MVFTCSDIFKIIRISPLTLTHLPSLSPNYQLAGWLALRTLLLTFPAFLITVAVILPPLGVFLEKGCDTDLFINILLTLLGYLPGIVHALYVVLI